MPVAEEKYTGRPLPRSRKEDCVPEDVIGENGLLKQLSKALLERAMNAELTNHLAYQKSDPAEWRDAQNVEGRF